MIVHDWSFKIFGEKAKLPNRNLRGVSANIFGLGQNSILQFILRLGGVWGRFKFSSDSTKNFYSKYRYRFWLRHQSPHLILFEQDLSRFRTIRRRFLQEMNTYRGLRVSLGLPARGQRTHTNAATANWKKKRRKFLKKKNNISLKFGNRKVKLLLGYLFFNNIRKFGWKIKL